MLQTVPLLEMCANLLTLQYLNFSSQDFFMAKMASNWKHIL